MKRRLLATILYAVLSCGPALTNAHADEKRAVITRAAELPEARYVDAKKGRDIARQIRRDAGARR